MKHVGWHRRRMVTQHQGMQHLSWTRDEAAGRYGGAGLHFLLHENSGRRWPSLLWGGSGLGT